MELYDLIAIYKCALYDSRSKILINRRNYIRGVINRLCSEYKIKINRDNIDDFKSEISLYLIRVISNCTSNIYGQIVKYFDTSVKGYFRKFLGKYKQNNYVLSLYDEKYKSSKGDSDAKRIIDYIPDSNNQYEEVEESQFSEQLLEVLTKLPNDDKNFIILRFQEDYSYEALSEYFNITLEEVREKETKILSFLKDNPSIKALNKTNNF